ncbi:MAG: hypothetical protein ABEJ25_08035 [Candidatus Bipolaricaulia bacterium]
MQTSRRQKIVLWGRRKLNYTQSRTGVKEIWTMKTVTEKGPRTIQPGK